MNDNPLSSKTLWADLGELATAVATQAGQLVLEMRRDAVQSYNTKSSATDLVTEADTQAEALIGRLLTQHRPNDAIQGEEGLSQPGTSGVVWHVDPIDGTTNFVYGLPAFSVSIGAEVNGQMVAGTVYDPSSGDTFAAVADGGAKLNGEPISINPAPPLATALVATGFSFQPEQRRRQAELLVELLPQVRDIRRLGSAALDLCSVGAGRVDAYFEQGLNQWDVAAGSLIAAEAGARVENLNDSSSDKLFTLAAHPELFEPLRQLITTAP